MAVLPPDTMPLSQATHESSDRVWAEKRYDGATKERTRCQT
jgi:hypothetical protein